jgi:hypothetical protein
VKSESPCPLLAPADPSSLPPLEWEPCDPDLAIPRCRRTRLGGVEHVDAAPATTTVSRTLGCRDGMVMEIAEIDGKVLAAVSFGEIPWTEGSCAAKLLAHGGGRWMFATEHHKEGFSWRTDSPSLTLLGGAARGPIQVLAREAEATPQHAFVDAKGLVYDAIGWRAKRWEDKGDAPRISAPSSSSGSWIFGGGTLFYTHADEGVLLIPLQGASAPILPKGAWYTLSADSHDLVFTAKRRAAGSCALFTSPVPATPADLSIHRLSQPCASAIVVGCGYALMGGGKRLSVVRLNDGAEAAIEAPSCDEKTKKGCLPPPTAMSCSDAFLDGSELYQIPLSAFGPLKPPSTPPVAVDAASLFDAPDGGASDGGASDGGASDGGAAEARDGGAVDAAAPAASDGGAASKP